MAIKEQKQKLTKKYVKTNVFTEENFMTCVVTSYTVKLSQLTVTLV